MSEEQVSIKFLWQAPKVLGKVPDDQWERDVIEPSREAIEDHMIRMLMLSTLPAIPDSTDDGWMLFAHRSFFHFNDHKNTEDDVGPHPLRFAKGDGVCYSGHEFGKKLTPVFPFQNETDVTNIKHVASNDYYQRGLIQVSLFFIDEPYRPAFIEHRTKDGLSVSLKTFDFSKYRQTISTT